MREIRLEENFEALLPEAIQPLQNISKSCIQVGSAQQDPTNKYDKASSGFESHYRQD